MALLGFRDAIVTTFTTFTKSGEGSFGLDPKNGLGAPIRVKDMIEDQIGRHRVHFGFGPFGLYVDCGFGRKDDCIGVVIARRRILPRL